MHQEISLLQYKIFQVSGFPLPRTKTKSPKKPKLPFFLYAKKAAGETSCSSKSDRAIYSLTQSHKGMSEPRRLILIKLKIIILVVKLSP
jgi:hypothetical protein